MLDLNQIRQTPQAIADALGKRLDHIDFSDLLAWDQEHRHLITETDGLKAQRNQTTAQRQKGQSAITPPQREALKTLSEQIKSLDRKKAALDQKIQHFLADLPNIPDPDVPAGDKENNQVLRTWGSKPTFDFTPLGHIELVERLQLIDYRRAAQIGGRGFCLYRGDGARLEWALLNYFVAAHLEAGFEFVLPPHILNQDCGFAAGQFPKFADEVFHLAEDPSKFLLPTAETALVNLHRDEILPQADLPHKYFAYTPCFRREAGSYRTSERGMVRGHQFNKVELFVFAHPQDSAAILDQLLDRGEQLMQGLGLHYRVAKLAAKDCSAAMAKTCDIEVWIPSMDAYIEVSSASTARDYQARRGQIRFKPAEGGKPQYLHTLNASGLATSRLFPALIEQLQRADGSVPVPKVLQPWVGKEILQPN